MAKRTDLRRKTTDAAAAVLGQQGHVNLLDVLCHMRWLEPHVRQRWEKGLLADLERCMQSTPERREEVFGIFRDWASSQDMRVVKGHHLASTISGARRLQVTIAGKAEWEELSCCYFLPASCTKRKLAALEKKVQKAPDLVVYRKAGLPAECAECGDEIPWQSLFVTEDEQPLCLACADLDHLEFLPSGDATFSRRARKNSPLSAVVVSFNRRRKRYERLGILVTMQAIAEAEAQCAADAGAREESRKKAAVRRAEADEELVAEMTSLILELFPGCPADEAGEIAAHTAVRGSGRVGRSAAGRSLDKEAMRLAVIAHIRHQHTDYDLLLMRGTPRTAARTRIQTALRAKLDAWEA